MAEHKYKVRSCKSADHPDQRSIFKIYLSPADMLSRQLRAGDACHIVTLPTSPALPAIVWPAFTKISDDVVQVSKALQALYGLNLGSQVSINKTNIAIIDAHEIALCEIHQNASEPALPYLDKEERPYWASLVKPHLSKPEILAPGMIFYCEHGDEKRSFRIHSINSSTDPLLYCVQPGCTVYVKESGIRRTISGTGLLVVSSKGVGGLDKQIESLNKEIAKCGNCHERDTELPLPLRARHGGILLHGAPGTGKTMVLGKICEAEWRGVFHIDGINVNMAKIQQIFSNALSCQPSVIIIDNLERIACRLGQTDLAGSGSVGHFLSRQLDRLDGTQTLAVGATRNLKEIDQDLRRVRRFKIEIEIPFPDSKSRAEILKVLCDLPKDETNLILDNVASRASGFVGEDLLELLNQAVRISGAQGTVSGSSIGDLGSRPNEAQALIQSMEDAFNSVLPNIQPIAMQGIMYNIPETTWNDIGGQHELKKRVQKALVWPVQHPDELKQSGLKATKGLLLYGPPGCSKTMIARATAKEAGLNFIAVKGAELLNMYVGESERAVREVFNKARYASPCIIFFDEIDALAAARNGNQQEGVHIVTTLLNELDGLEELKGVAVLAATNRPEIIDPALMRAGRFSQALYVGLPGLEDRQEILQMQGPVILSDHVDVMAFSQMTQGFTGAELVEICQEAGYMALEAHLESKQDRRITMDHLTNASTKVGRSVDTAMEAKYKAWEANRH